MSTAANEAGNIIATREQLEGSPDSRAYDIEVTDRGVVMVGVNVDGETRRMFVSRALMPGVREATDAFTEAVHYRDDPPDDDTEDDDDVDERVEELEREVENYRHLASEWEGMARAMWEAAGRPAQNDPPLDRWTDTDAARVISRIVEERNELRNLRDQAQSRPYDAIATALGLDPRSTASAIIAQIQATRADHGHRAKVPEAGWNLALAQWLHDRYETDGPDKLPASQWQLVEALGYALRLASAEVAG